MHAEGYSRKPLHIFLDGAAASAPRARGCSSAVESSSAASKTCGAPGTFPSQRRCRTTNAKITKASLRLREQHAQQLTYLHPFLLHRIAMPERDGVEQRRVLFAERLEINREAERRPGFILPPITPPDRAGLVVENIHMRAERRLDLA